MQSVAYSLPPTTYVFNILMLKVIKIFNFQELVLYLLQLVQALRYENFKKTAKGSTVQITAATQQNKETKLPNNTQNNNSSDNINRTNINTDATGTQQQNMFVGTYICLVLFQ